MGTHQRRYAIWALLAGTPEGLTLRGLAQQFGVAKNTIQRDLDELSRGGASIFEEQVGQTMLFRARSEPPAANLTEGEKVALSSAASFVPWAGTHLATDLATALAKVGAGGGVPMELKGPVPNVRLEPSVLKTVLEGLRHHRRCTLLYQRRRAQKARVLKVEPLRIVAGTGLLYLRAVVRPRGVVVTLALHLVKMAELLEEPFTPIRDAESAFNAADEQPEHVVVRFHPDIAPFIEERIWHPSQRLEHEPDGWLRFEATLGGMHEFVGWVMSWGGRAEILRPARWRAETVARLDHLNGVYADEVAN